MIDKIANNIIIIFFIVNSYFLSIAAFKEDSEDPELRAELPADFFWALKFDKALNAFDSDELTCTLLLVPEELGLLLEQPTIIKHKLSINNFFIL